MAAPAARLVAAATGRQPLWNVRGRTRCPPRFPRIRSIAPDPGPHMDGPCGRFLCPPSTSPTVPIIRPRRASPHVRTVPPRPKAKDGAFVHPLPDFDLGTAGRGAILAILGFQVMNTLVPSIDLPEALLSGGRSAVAFSTKHRLSEALKSRFRSPFPLPLVRPTGVPTPRAPKQISSSSSPPVWLALPHPIRQADTQAPIPMPSRVIQQNRKIIEQ